MIYIDLDGVLADFDKAKKALGTFPSDTEMWDAIGKIPDWYRNLDLCPDARKLWNYCNHYWDVTVLTAVPKRVLKDTAAQDKRKWVRFHLGPDVPVITCHREEKQEYAISLGKDGEIFDNILIDDSGINIGQWMMSGGIGILHSNVTETLSCLRELRPNVTQE